MLLKVLITLSTLLPAFAQRKTGGVDGGGGESIVCRDENGRVTSAQILDLYEGPILHGLSIAKSNAPASEQVRAALNVLPPTTRALVAGSVANVQAHVKIVPKGTELLSIDDSRKIFIPRGCAPEQLANYYNDNLILVSSDIWNVLDETNRAALILHEGIYAMNRTFGATDSRVTRHVVASLFDPSTRWTDVKEGVPADALNCFSPSGGLVVWAYKSSPQEWTLQFNVLASELQPSKKTFVVNAAKFDLEQTRAFPVLPGEGLIGTSEGTTGIVRSEFEGADILAVTKRWESIVADGQPLAGFQTPRYSLDFISGTYANKSASRLMLNCGVTYGP